MLNNEEVGLSLSKDTEGNSYMSLPHRPVQLPEGKKLDSSKVIPYVKVKLWDVQEVLNAYRDHNTALVNKILSQYH